MLGQYLDASSLFESRLSAVTEATVGAVAARLPASKVGRSERGGVQKSSFLQR